MKKNLNLLSKWSEDLIFDIWYEEISVEKG